MPLEPTTGKQHVDSIQTENNAFMCVSVCECVSVSTLCGSVRVAW